MEQQRRHLVPLPTLCARMRLLLELFLPKVRNPSSWGSVGNLLLPPASLSRVVTDTSAADLYGAAAYCSSASNYDDIQSELLDDHMLELVRFHFVWNVYETVRCISGVGCKMTSNNHEDRLSLLGAVPSALKELLTWEYETCLSLSKVKPVICKRMEKGNEASVLGKAGLLMAGFRDYVFHGEETPPEPDDLEDTFNGMLDGTRSLSAQAYRMLSFTRLTLHVLQVLIHADLREDASIPVNDVPFLSSCHDYEFDIPCKFVLNLANCWSEELTPRLSLLDIEYFASGCNVPSDILETMCSTEVI